MCYYEAAWARCSQMSEACRGSESVSDCQWLTAAGNETSRDRLDRCTQRLPSLIIGLKFGPHTPTLTLARFFSKLNQFIFGLEGTKPSTKNEIFRLYIFFRYILFTVSQKCTNTHRHTKKCHRNKTRGPVALTIYLTFWQMIPLYRALWISSM